MSDSDDSDDSDDSNDINSNVDYDDDGIVRVDGDGNDDDEATPAWLRYLPNVPWDKNANNTTAINTTTNNNINTHINDTNINDSNRRPISSNKFFPKELINNNCKKRGRDNDTTTSTSTTNDDDDVDNFHSKRYKRVAHIGETEKLLEMFNVNKN